MHLTPAYYLALRRRFEPTIIKLVVIAESPPVSGKYFYDPEGLPTEALFAALMKQINFTPTTKAEGLLAFQEKGWVLVDATYETINAYSNKERDAAIARNYPSLLADLKRLLGGQSIYAPLVLLKANVCDLLEPKLVADGFNVLNEGRRVYFPSHGRQNDFARQFREIARPLVA
jgi:hypothetical protein